MIRRYQFEIILTLLLLCGALSIFFLLVNVASTLILFSLCSRHVYSYLTGLL